MQTLLDAIRKSLPPAAWSRGVSLCREGRVVFVAPGKLRAAEIEAEVAPPTGGVAAHVILYPDDAEWECDCDVAATQPACAHAAAAAISLGQARAGKAPAARAQVRTARVHYAFARAAGGLALRREVVSDDGEGPREELAVPLAVRQRQPGAQLLTAPHDAAVDALLAGRRTDGALHATLLQRLLGALIDAAHVTLDGAPVQVGEPTASFAVRVQAEAGGGALVRAQPPAGLSERFANGVGRFGRALQPLSTPQLSERDQQALHAGQHFAADAMPTLLGEVLPRLARHVSVDRAALAAVDEVAAEVRVQLSVVAEATERGTTAGPPAGDGDYAPAARVVAQLVYVLPTPPGAQAGAEAPEVVGRVVGEALRAVGRRVPRRSPSAEAQATQRLAEALALAPGTARSLHGARDVAFIARLRAFAVREAALVHDPEGALMAWRLRGVLRPSLASTPLQAATGSAGSPSPADEALTLAELTFLSDDGATAPAAGGGRAALGLGAVLAAFARGESHLAVPGGGFAPVPGPLLAQHLEPLRALLAAREASATEARAAGGAGAPSGWALAALGRVGEALELEVPPTARAAYQALQVPVAPGANEEAARALPPLPPGLTLRPYQRAGIAWLATRAKLGVGALLADDMGLGKTLQTLLALQGAAPGCKLVVVPTSVLTNWEDEAARFCPGARVVRYHGPGRDLAGARHADWVLTSYGVLRLEAEALAALRPTALVLDEAHVLKGQTTQVARAAATVATSARACLALTGTPLENRPEDLFGLMHLLNPGLLGDEASFRQTFAQPLQQGDADAAAALRERLQPVLLRRLKRDVARDLPPRTDVVLRCELSGEERGIYDAILQATRREVVARLQADGNVMAALEALLRLRQAACHVGLLPGHGERQHSSKLTLLRETLRQGIDEGHRALVFSQWTGLLDRVEPLLRAEEIDFARLDGSTPNRGEVVRTFADAQGPPVLLMSLKAGGVGLNLTAADHVFLLDPWWNPAAEDQAADRANRIGQTRPVLVHRLVASDTVEEGILRLQAHKRAMAEAALSGETQVGAGAQRAGLDKADLLQLLAG